MKEMKFSRQNQGNFLTSKEFSGNALVNELPLGLQTKFCFMFDVFWIFWQLAKFQLTLAGSVNKNSLWGGQN